MLSTNHSYTIVVRSTIGPKAELGIIGSWQYRCVQEALQGFRRWRRGGFADWARAGPQPAMPDTMDASMAYVETVADMRQRRAFWWITELTRSFRRFAALRSKQLQLVDNKKWETLAGRFKFAMTSTSKRAINQLCKKHKDFVLDPHRTQGTYDSYTRMLLGVH